MKRICLFLIAFTLLLAGCNSNKVKVRGKVIGLQGTEIVGRDAGTTRIGDLSPARCYGR